MAKQISHPTCPADSAAKHCCDPDDVRLPPECRSISDSLFMITIYTQIRLWSVLFS